MAEPDHSPVFIGVPPFTASVQLPDASTILHLYRWPLGGNASLSSFGRKEGILGNILLLERAIILDLVLWSLPTYQGRGDGALIIS